MNIASAKSAARPNVCLLAILATALMVGCSSTATTEVAERRQERDTEPTIGEPTKPEAAATEPPGAELSAAPVPQNHTSYIRSSAEATGEPATIPPVFLTEGHKSLCLVGVGDKMPAIELQQLGGGRAKLANLLGSKATVVFFWKGDRRLALAELADLGPDVAEPFKDAGVAVVGIAVGHSAGEARAATRRAKVDYPQLIDADGAAFAKVGSEKLPRTYLLDSEGNVLWFDIEYSTTTRRELAQSLEAVAGRK
jgi:peroxiredoxin